MAELLAFLKLFQERIGYEPIVFLALALVGAGFASDLGDEGAEGLLRFGIMVASASFFMLGVLIAVVRVSSALFAKRPARGLVDGMSAGIVAGVVGGLLGYGFHDVYMHPAGIAWPYESPGYVRAGLCLLFAVPIGGVLGALIDLIHPDRDVEWRSYVSVLVAAVVVLLLIVWLGVTIYAPNVDGPGITLGDIQLLFEVFVVAMFVIVTVGYDWPMQKVVSRLGVFVLAVGLARLVTMMIDIQDIEGFTTPLADRRFIYIEPRTGVDRLQAGNEYHIMGLVVVALMAWAYAAYAAAFTNNPLTRRLDRLAGVGQATVDARVGT